MSAARKPSRRRGSARLEPEGPLHRALLDVLAGTDLRARVATDPVEFVHREVDPLDAEIVALLAAAVAFGNVKALRAKLREALDRIGEHPARACDDEARVHRVMQGWVHRVYRGQDVAQLLIGARRVQRAHGSLGRAFASFLGHGDLRAALSLWVSAVRSEGGLDRSSRRGARHILPDPASGSGCKRLLLFLRWMVRGPDGVDLGLWRDLVRADQLLMPVDVHIHKLSMNLGLTSRATAGWRTTVEITEALRRFDRDDPVRFDFALCHMGMLRKCPSRRDDARCDGCPVKPVCRWWEADEATAFAGRTSSRARRRSSRPARRPA